MPKDTRFEKPVSAWVEPSCDEVPLAKPVSSQQGEGAPGSEDPITVGRPAMCAASFKRSEQGASMSGDMPPVVPDPSVSNCFEVTGDSLSPYASGSARSATDSWHAVCTTDFKLLTALLTDAQTHSNVFAVTGEAGTGKSFCLRQYAGSHACAHLLQCSGYWNRKYFLAQLLAALRCDGSGLSVAGMMEQAVAQLKVQRQPLLILDEADKLSDQVLYLFITLYNQLENHCGIVLCATDHLESRLRRGLKLNKRGYKEIFSRIGRKCIALSGVGFTDVMQICKANGIAGKPQVRSVFNQCEGDLRRVRRRIHAIKNAG